jgi:addiction module HigA family antidote
MSSYALAKALHVPAPRIHDIVLERRAVSPDSALRLARYFGTSEQFWMNMQIAFDLHSVRKSAGSILKKIKPLQKTAA